MPPKFKRHLNDDEVTGSVKSERSWQTPPGCSGSTEASLQGRNTAQLRYLKGSTAVIPGGLTVRCAQKVRCCPEGGVKWLILMVLFFVCSQRNLLEEDSDEEEDFFLRGSSGPRFGPRNDKIRHVQNQVDEVIDVMQENITKVIERGERLDDLQDKSESLSDNATAFSNRAKQLRRQMWWRGCKMKAIIALVAVVLLLVIIIPIVLKYHT